MESSPRSTASSDLYPPSDPASPELHARHGTDFLNSGEDLHVSLDFARGDSQGSCYSDTMQGLDSVGDELSRPSSIVSDSLANKSPKVTSHKRKREQDAVPEDLPLTDQDTAQFSPKADGFEPMRPILAEVHTLRSLEELSRIKRQRTQGHDEGSLAKLECPSNPCGLSAMIWQYICCYVPPVFLGRLMRVNHVFNNLLTPGRTLGPFEKPSGNTLQLLTAEDIWIASRRRFAPGLPRPLQGLRELDVWRLLRGQDCQICGIAKNTSPVTSPENLWESGPGHSKVRIIWSFGVRCCGSCLRKSSRSERDLFISSDYPTFLLQALPFALVSADNHYIPHNIIRTVTPPSTIQIERCYYKPHMEEIKSRLEKVKELGAASAEEWTKGLPIQGQECLEDIIRWEQWESKGGLKKVNLRPQAKAPFPGTLNGKVSHGKSESQPGRSTPQTGIMAPRVDGTVASPAAMMYTNPLAKTKAASASASQPILNSVSSFADGHVQFYPTPMHQSRPERSIRDINEAKAARRAEIERRCAALDPPMLPSVLNHMESFQAAMQITQPMTDQAWQILKPRLLAQLPYAERMESERLQQNELAAEAYRQRRQQENQMKETKESSDREWETFQVSVRSRIGALADEAIETRWAGGKNLSKEYCPKFAADVLLSVRERFHSDIAQEDATALANRNTIKTGSPHGLPTRKLTLENMKWLFDTKIKPLTDHFQRELFLCSVCEGNNKFYGFEGVIQHYAAKHTIALSMGNIVVHWRAEWPDEPPFNPNPSPAKSTQYKVPAPAIPVQSSLLQDSQEPTMYPNYGQATEPDIPIHLHRDGNAQPSFDSYQGPYTGSREAVPQQAPLVQSSFPHSMYTIDAGYPRGHAESTTAVTPYDPYFDTHHGQTFQVYGSSYPAQSAFPDHGTWPPGTTPQGPLSVTTHHIHGASTQGVQINLANSNLPPHVPNGPMPVSDLYQRQMDEMAKHAKDIFTSIGGVKDLPGSVRIFVVIQHTVSRFKATFPNEPSLSMFIDGLDHNAVMRPVRSVNGLGCKTCMYANTGAKLFTLPHLVNHFRTAHLESPQAVNYGPAELDWKHDMIDLPDVSIISKLSTASGMTDAKFSLIAAAFPRVFSAPLYSARDRANPISVPIYKNEVDLNRTGGFALPSNALMTENLHLANKTPEKHYRSDIYDETRPVSQERSSEPLDPPGEDEYDPKRPAFLGKLVKIEPGSSHSHKTAGLSVPQSTTWVSHQAHHDQFRRERSGRLEGEDFDTTDMSHNRPVEFSKSIAPSRTRRTELMLSSQNGRVVPIAHWVKPKAPGTQDRYETPDSIDRNFYGASGNKASDEGPKHSKQGSLSRSPPEAAEAADQFLSTLAPRSGPSLPRPAYPLDTGTDRRFSGPRRREPLGKHQQEYLGADNAQDHEYDLPLDHTNSAMELRSASESTSQQISDNHTHYSKENNQHSPLFRIPVNSPDTANPADELQSKFNNSSRRGFNHETSRINADDVGKSRSASYSRQMLRIQPGRDGSSSPHLTPPDGTLYRPRSPLEEDRRVPVYQVHSPTTREQNGNQRLLNYDHVPQSRYHYTDEHELPEKLYRPRIEYVRVPLGFEDSAPRERTRYVLARPVEHMEPEYVRYETDYAGGPIYERTSQLYHVPQRKYQEQPSRATQSPSQGYTY